MSTTIDERVVSMQFDNKHFERNVGTSVNSLEKLKQSLNLTGSAKGLESISNAAKTTDMSGLANGVESVRVKFSALQVMAVTALANISNQVLSTGQKMVSAFTIEPIKAGLQEYETQINSVQTILANTESKGTTLDQVNSALDELNKYADLTIYNFTEMTRNIGTFTAAGVDLDTSVTAIQGIANLAAVSGSTSQQASTAMYQLSQALAAGTVKLTDWNSVVSAGMGGQVFQDALRETSEQLNTGAEAAIKAQGSFRESLSTGWLTSEVLTETLKKFTKSGANEYIAEYTGLSADAVQAALDSAEAQYGEAHAIEKASLALAEKSGKNADEIKQVLQLASTAQDAATKVKTFSQLMDTLKEAAQSGWTQTWEILIGDFEEAKELWTSVSDVFGEIINTSAEARNTMLEGAMTSNWDKMLQKIEEAGVEASTFEGELKAVLEGQGYSIDKLIEEHGSLEKAFKSGVVSSDHLRTAIDGLNISFKDSPESVDDLISGITKLGGRELLIESVKNAFEALKNILAPIGKAFQEVFPPTTSEQLYSVIERIHALTEGFKEITSKYGPQIYSTFHGIFSAIDIGITVIKEVVSGIAKLIGNFTGLGGGILGVTGSIGEWISGLRTAAKEHNIITSSVDKVTDGLQWVIDKIKVCYGFLKEKITMPGWEGFFSIIGAILDTISKIGKKVADVGSVIGDALANAFQIGDINDALEILNGGIFTGILLGINKYIKGITDAFDDSSIGILDRIKSTFENLSGIFDSVGQSLQAWQQNLKAGVLLKIAGAIGILALSILVIATIDPEKLAAALGAVTVLFADLMGSMAIFDKMGGTYKSAVKAVTLMIGMAIAINILAGALQKIAELDTGKMYNGILGIMLLTAIIVKAAKEMSNNTEQMAKGAGGLIVLALAVKILASAVKDLSTLSWEELAKGLTGVAVLLTALSAFLNNTKFSGDSLGTAFGVLVLAAAIKLLASACKDFANMSWEEIAKGLVAIGVLLAEIALFAHFTKDVKNLFSTALAMLIIAAAMKVFASAMADFGALSWEEIAKGLISIAGLLFTVAGAVNVMPNATQMIGIGAGLLIIAAAMKVFASAMADFGALSWEEIAKGLISIAASLTIVTIAVNNMPQNMISMGAGLLLVSAALLVVAEAMSQMGSMTWEEIAKGLVALAGSMTILALGLKAMQGSLGASTALLVASTAIVILASALNLMGSMSWGEIVAGLVALAGAFTVVGVAALVLAPLSANIIALGASIALMGIGIAAMAAGLAYMAVVGTAAAVGIVAALTIIVEGVIALIPKVITAITEYAPAIGEAVKAIVLSLIDVIVECVPAMVEGVLQLVSEVLSAIATYGPQIVDLILVILISLINSLADRLPELIQAAANLIGSFFGGITSVLQNVDSTTLLNTIASVGVLAALMLALGAIAALVPAAMVGVLALGALIVELGLVLAAIGALAQIPGLEWLISEGGDFIQTVGTAIGQFIGGIIGGVAQGITSVLPQIGSDLSEFITNADPFITGAKAIDSSMMDGVKTLVETILLLTGASIIEALTSWFSGGSSLADFGAEIAAFGPYLASFASSVAGIDGEAVKAAAEAAKTLTEMASTVPNQGGLAAWFAGENSLAAFGAQIIAFGAALKAYSIVVTGIDVAAVVASTEAGKALTEMASTVPNQGGIVAWFAGENSLAAFGAQIIAFGVALKAYSIAVTGIDVAAVVTSTEAGKALTELANTVPNQGGLAAWFTGDNSIAAFGDELVIFGRSLKSYADSVTGIDAAAVAASVAAGASLVTLSTTIPEDKLFKNETTLSEFGRIISEYGGYLLQYFQYISGIDMSGLSSAITQTNRLVEMAKGMVDLDTSGMSSFSSALTKLGQAGIDAFITTFTGAVSRVTAAIDTLMSGVITSINSKQATFNSSAQSLIQQVVTGITTKAPEVIDAVSTIITNLLTLIEESYPEFNTSGTEVMANFIEGVDSKEPDAVSSFTRILDTVIQTIRGYYDGAKSAGAYLVDGFCAGITENTFKAQARAAAMARAALEAAEEELDVESPSKEFYSIGEYSVEGFTNALIDGATTSYDAGASMVSAAKTGLSNAIANITDMVNSDVDLQPTISPVLDLSDVESGVDLLSSMFGVQPSVGVLATLESIGSSMNRIQNGVSDDIVSAINGLKDVITATSGDTYTVNGITYDDGSNITESIKSLIRAARVERRV